MFLERLVYSLLCLFFLGYIAKKYSKTQVNMFLVMTALQIIASIVSIMAIINNIYLSVPLQTYTFIIGIVAPALIFSTDYIGINTAELIDILIGNYYMKHANYKKAIEKYKKAVIRNPDNSENFVKLRKSIQCNWR